MAYKDHPWLHDSNPISGTLGIAFCPGNVDTAHELNIFDTLGQHDTRHVLDSRCYLLIFFEVSHIYIVSGSPVQSIFACVPFDVNDIDCIQSTPYQTMLLTETEFPPGPAVIIDVLILF